MAQLILIRANAFFDFGPEAGPERCTTRDRAHSAGRIPDAKSRFLFESGNRRPAASNAVPSTYRPRTAAKPTKPIPEAQIGRCANHGGIETKLAASSLDAINPSRSEKDLSLADNSGTQRTYTPVFMDYCSNGGQRPSNQKHRRVKSSWLASFSIACCRDESCGH